MGTVHITGTLISINIQTIIAIIIITPDTDITGTVHFMASSTTEDTFMVQDPRIVVDGNICL